MRRLIFAVLLFALFLPSPVSARTRNHPRIFAVERAIAALPYELGIGYDRHGREVWRVKGTANQYLPTADQDWQTLSGGQTHNHPGEGACVALSRADLMGTYRLRLAWLRAVSIDRAGRVHVAVIFQPWRLATFDPQRVADVFKRYERKYPWCTEWRHAWSELFGADHEVYADD